MFIGLQHELQKQRLACSIHTVHGFWAKWVSVKALAYVCAVGVNGHHQTKMRMCPKGTAIK